jgi:ketosteroid isomerase-like protein
VATVPAPEPVADLRTVQRDDRLAAVAPKPEPVAPAVPTPANVAPTVPDMPPERTVAAIAPTPAAAAALAPTPDEIEAQFVAFVDAYNRGRLDAMAALFDNDAQTIQRQGRAAIRSDYDDLFRRSDSRRMSVSRMSWTLSGDVAQVKAEGAVRIAWRDGREAEERLALDMDLARRDGRVVIVRLAQRTGAP